ncbi:MAG: MlaD family protein [Bacteroidota bacterium]|nr:MlaD family protein [Bacteroidota bacterium]
MHNKEFFLGIICVVAGIALFFGIKFLSGDSNPLFNNNKFYVKYDNIDGLEKSNDITINGGVIGQVTDLILIPSNNSWLVELTIDEPKVLGQLTKQSLFEIQDDGFLGTKIILLKLAPGDKVFPGDTLNGSSNGLISQFSRQFDGFDIQQVVSPILELLEKITTLTSDIDRIIVSNEKNVNGIISNSENIVKSLSKNAKNFNNLINNLSDFSNELSSLSLPEISVNLNNDLKKLNSILNKIDQGNGSVAKVINSDDLIEEFEATLKSIKSLVEDFEKNPKKYFKEIKLLRK